MSASDDRVHAGLGTTPRVDDFIVEWPDGLRESFPGSAADRLVTLRRGTGQRIQ